MTADWQVIRPRRRGEPWVQRDGEETAVYNPDTGMLHLLNASARAIWDLCDGDTQPQEMAAAISDLTGLDADDAWSDVTSTLDRLAALGLIDGDGTSLPPAP
jgi:PqqD family protein of HPr-rel-A system